jgi:putative ABC transport system permease protein
MNDLRHALRQLRKHPFANGVIVLTIALLIGTVSVIYASLRHDQKRYEPFPGSERMVKLWREGEQRFEELFPAGVIREYTSNLHSYEEVGVVDWGESLTLTGQGEPVSYSSVNVSASLLRVARITPLKGRLLDEEDEAPGARTILVSEKLWRTKLGGDDSALGRDIRLNDRPYTVVGVVPAAFSHTRLAYNVDVWRAKRFETSRDGVNLRLFGRLKPGVTMAQAQAELDAVAPGIEKAHTPDDYERRSSPGGYVGARVASLRERLRPVQAGVPVELILVWVFATTIIGSVVGIACFNVTNLLLARLAARSRELAIRQSLGAGRGTIVRHILAETLLLAVLGGTLGLAVSFWFHDLLRFDHVDVRFDWRLYAWTTGGTLLLGVLVGLLPAFQATRLDVHSVLKDSSQTGGGRRRHRLRNFLVSSEVAMALILCVIGGLLVRSYVGLRAGDFGFEPARVVAFKVDLRNDTYRERKDQQAYYERALAALRAVPGVESASATMSGNLLSFLFKDDVWIEEPGRERTRVKTPLNYVTRGHAGAFGMTILRGRDLSADPEAAWHEALVSESFVRAHFKGRDPVGSRIRLVRERQQEESATIVGVVRDRHPATSHLEVDHEVFFGLRRSMMTASTVFIVQTRPHAHSMAPALREALQSLDANQPVNQPQFFGDLLEQRAEGPRKAMTMLGSIAGLGLFIALMGVYGVVAFTAMERTREVGIRMAVGASRAAVLKLIMWQGAQLLLWGAIPGLLIGATIVALLPMGGMFPGVSAFDPVTHLAIVLLVGSAGLLASGLPACRAANLEPMEALRYE